MQRKKACGQIYISIISIDTTHLAHKPESVIISELTNAIRKGPPSSSLIYSPSYL
jgi:hypothetical protein